jgi:hypothetical protein
LSHCATGDFSRKAQCHGVVGLFNDAFLFAPFWLHALPILLDLIILIILGEEYKL